MKLIQYLHRIFNELYLMLNSHYRAVRWLRFMISKRTVWLSKEQKVEFWTREVESAGNVSVWKLIKAMAVAQELFGVEVPDYCILLLGPVFRNELDAYTPLRYRQVMRLINSNTSDIEMFIRIYTEGAIPAHRWIYLKNTGVWDKVVSGLVASRRSRLAA